MIELCGRFNFDVEACWEMTPREFEELVRGGIAREREARLNVATLISTIHGALGQRTSPLMLLGEEDSRGTDDVFPGETKKERRRRVQEGLRRKHEKMAEEWRPAEIPLDAGSATPFVPEGIVVVDEEPPWTH